MVLKKIIPEDMRMAVVALALTTLVAVVLSILAWDWLEAFFPAPAQPQLEVLYLEQYINVAQVIVVGFFVALTTVIIQFMLPETRDRFERYKESRRAYSRAKTSVLYLPDRVLNTDLENAFILVEKAHRDLHLAETFIDVIISKGYLDWYENKELWILYNYWQIVAVAEVLRSRHVNFDKKRQLSKALEKAVGAVHKRFGRRGENCKGENWDLDNKERVTYNKNRLDEEQRILNEIRKHTRTAEKSE